jgi:hypothetical protein
MAFKMKYKGSSPYPQKKAWEDLGDEEKEKEGKRFGPVDDEDWTPPQPEPGKLKIDKDKDEDDTPWIEGGKGPLEQGKTHWRDKLTAFGRAMGDELRHTSGYGGEMEFPWQRAYRDYKAEKRKLRKARQRKEGMDE